jgi:hypothetical protein
MKIEHIEEAKHPIRIKLTEAEAAILTQLLGQTGGSDPITFDIYYALSDFVDADDDYGFDGGITPMFNKVR